MSFGKGLSEKDGSLKEMSGNELIEEAIQRNKIA